MNASQSQRHLSEPRGSANCIDTRAVAHAPVAQSSPTGQSWRPSLLGSRAISETGSLLGWRPSLLGSRPSWLEVIAGRLEAIATSGGHRSWVGGHCLLVLACDVSEIKVLGLTRPSPA